MTLTAHFNLRIRDLPVIRAQLADPLLERYLDDLVSDSAARPERAMAALRCAAERLLRQLVEAALRACTIEATSALLREQLPKLDKGQFTGTLEKLRDRALVTPGLALRFTQLWAWGSPAHHDQRTALGFTAVDVERQLGPLVELIDHVRAQRGEPPLVPPEVDVGALPAATPTWLARAITTQRLASEATRAGRVDLPSLAVSVLWQPAVAADRPPTHRFGAYDVDDGAWFFGREVLLEQLDGLLRKHRRALVSGASGSGKSSLLRAGLGPRLLAGGGQLVVVGDYLSGTPRFLEALSAGARGIAVVADQLDHLLAPGFSAALRGEVLTQLAAVAATDGVALIAAVREDCLGLLLRVLGEEHPALAEALDLRRTLFTVGPLGIADAIEVLDHNLTRRGRVVERDRLREQLAPAIQIDAGVPSISPFVVQALLGELEQSTSPRVVLDVAAALGGHVEEALRHLPRDRIELARTMLKEMATGDTRTWVDLYALAAIAEVQLLEREVVLLPGELGAVELVSAVLEVLLERRIVVARRVGVGGTQEFTLIHDRLAALVAPWRTPDELERAQAQEELDRAARDEAAGRGESLAAAPLARIERHWRALRKDDGALVALGRGRRARRVVRATFGALVALATSALGFGVWQYTQVTHARALVEARRLEGEQLLSFMLDDLRVKLEQVGRLDLLDDVLVRARDHFERWPDDRSERTMQGRAAVRLYQGRSSEAKGDLVAALASYTEALAIIDREDPGDVARAWQVLRFETLRAIGDTALFQGELTVAHANDEKLVALARRRLAEAPGDRGRRQDVASSLGTLGDVFQSEGKLDDALVRFDESLALRRGLINEDDADDAGQHLLAITLNKIAKAYVLKGDARQALPPAREQVERFGQLVAKAPEDRPRRRWLVFGLVRLGEALELSDQGPEALTIYRRAETEARAMVAFDPSNTTWRRDLSVARHREGRVLARQGDRAGAEAALREALAIRESLVARDPSRAFWKDDLAEAHASLGTFLRDGGDVVAARAELEAARTTLVPLAASSPARRQALAGVEAALAGLPTVGAR